MMLIPANTTTTPRIIYVFLSLVSVIIFLLSPNNFHAQNDPIDDLISRMSLEERVGQLFVVRSWGKTANRSFQELIESIHPGGIVLLNENLTDPQGIVTLTNGLQTLATTRNANHNAKIPLLIMLDQEGGKIQRLRNGFTQLANPLLLGAITDEQLLLDYGEMVGGQLRAVGVNMNLAPVVDLATNPQNPVVFNRMLGDNPQQVATVARHLMRGMSQAGVISVAKHFPGHGDVPDTHVRSGWLAHDLARLESVELFPFLNSDAPVIMMGHISAPALDPSGLPATLSSPMVNYLRQHNYNNVIMTDAMDMGAITNYFSAEEAAVTALKAGIDLLLLGAHPNNSEQIGTYRAVLNAVKSGEISEDQVNASVRRILKLKAEHNLINWTPLIIEDTESRLAKTEGDALLARTYMAGMTLVHNNDGQIPIKMGWRIAVMFPSKYHEIGERCTDYARQTGVEFQLMPFEYNPVNWQLGRAESLAKQVDTSIVFIENLIQNPNQSLLLQKLPEDKTVVVALGLPHQNRVPSTIAGYLLAYDPSPPAFDAACAVLFGVQSPAGVLSVTQSSWMADE